MSKPMDGPVSRYLNRYLSAPVSSVFLKTNVTPNQVTLLVSSLTIPMLVLGFYGQVIAVGAVLQIASVLDGCDGEIARTKDLKSDFGALLDTVSDHWLDSVGITALGLALIRMSAVPIVLVLLLTALTVAVRLISQYVVAKTVLARRAHVVRDSRDVVTILIFVGAVLAGLLSPWFLVGILVFVDLWRLDNTVYQLYQAAKSKQ